MQNATPERTLHNKNHLPFLKGDGEMVNLVRSYDWSQTSLGEPSQWPQSLRTTLSIILSSKFPMFLFWGPDLICFYNDAYRPSLGNDGKHPFALGKPGAQIWPEIWQHIKPLIDQVLSGGGATWSEDQLLPIYRNGKLEDVYWTFSYSPVIAETGEPAGVFVTCTETTEKVLLFRKLAETNQQLAFAIESTDLGTWEYKLGSGRFHVNQRFLDWFGFNNQSEVTTDMILSAIEENDRVRLRTAAKKVIATMQEGKFDVQFAVINRISQEVRTLNAKGKLLLNEQNIPYRFSGTIEDITEEIVGRQKMEKVYNELQRTNDSLQLALYAGKLGSCQLYLDSGKVDCTPQFKFNFGLKEDDYLDYDIAIGVVHPDDKEMVIKELTEAINACSVYNFEYRVIWADGSLHWIYASGRPIPDESGKATLVTGVTLDITEQKLFAEELSAQVEQRTRQLEQANEALQRTNEELGRSNINLEEFAYAASHDLKEPIRKIYFFSDRIESTMADRFTEEEKTYFKRMRLAANRMGSLIDDLLSYSQVSIKPRDYEMISLNSVVQQVIDDLEVEIADKHAMIMVDPLPTIYGHQRQLQQAFQNLLSNALKYHKPGLAPVVRITIHENYQPEGVHFPAEKKFVSVGITDDGIGFEQSEAEKIFNVFTRLHGNSEYKGTGVGLSIVRKVLQNHQGFVQATSQPDNGATFHLFFPMES